MQVDFGRTATDYARHRAGFPEELFERLAAQGIGRAGQRVLDLGSGTGSLARGFAQAGARVMALDISEDLLAQARALAAEEGVAIETLCAPAEDSGLAAARFDVVSAGQCWHWFERPRAAAEARRLLAPGGRLAICHFDWLPLPGNVVAATEALIEAHNPAWTLGGGDGFYPAWADDAAGAGDLALAPVVVPERSGVDVQKIPPRRGRTAPASQRTATRASTSACAVALPSMAKANWRSASRACPMAR